MHDENISPGRFASENQSRCNRGHAGSADTISPTFQSRDNSALNDTKLRDKMETIETRIVTFRTAVNAVDKNGPRSTPRKKKRDTPPAARRYYSR